MLRTSPQRLNQAAYLAEYLADETTSPAAQERLLSLANLLRAQSGPDELECQSEAAQAHGGLGNAYTALQTLLAATDLTR